ncbi:MAG TPA: hypothetical protein VMY78_09060 [Solirubrobacteraceae bacterium]|nr:hypothetical protein [Solirubrobacteraceae bacterium]
MDHDELEEQEKTATEDGVASQAEELQDKHAQNAEDAADPRDPDQWRKMPKEGGGA